MMAKPVCVLMLTSAVSLSAEPLTQGDRDFAVSALWATRKQLLDTAAQATPAQWKFKPSPQVWSLAEVAEHLALSEERLFNIATQRALKSPLNEEEKKTLSTRQKDELILKQVPVRDQKMQAPEMLVPSGRFSSRDDVIAAFQKKRDSNIAYIKETQDELRGHFFTHPVLGPLDAYQWFLMMAAHTERHVNQMKEVMARPDFPKN